MVVNVSFPPVLLLHVRVRDVHVLKLGVVVLVLFFADTVYLPALT